MQTCIGVLNSEEDQIIRGVLLQAVLRNFATEGVEPARRFVLGTPLDPDVLEVRSALLTACKLMGQRFPEFNAWLADSQTDHEFRRKWHEEHPQPGYAKEDRDRDFEEGLEVECEEQPALLPTTFVRRNAGIGRNDPCPCGSGKQFKNCCMNKGQVEDKSDCGHAAAMSRVRHRQSPPKYPIGTVAFYGPDDKTTTKIAAGVILRENAEPIVERWVGTNVKDNPKVQGQMRQFFAKHGVKSVVATDRNMGCPHEEGEDFPSGEDCPFCPFWKGKQGTARRS